jgi:hypothetical protein
MSRAVSAAASITPDSWEPLPASSIRTPIRVQERGSERLFVSWSSNLGSTLSFLLSIYVLAVSCSNNSDDYWRGL